jgi:hypothetical protein
VTCRDLDAAPSDHLDSRQEPEATFSFERGDGGDHQRTSRDREDASVGLDRPAGLVINIGSGTGSYEPVSRDVVAVGPSRVILSQYVGPFVTKL